MYTLINYLIKSFLLLESGKKFSFSRQARQVSIRYTLSPPPRDDDVNLINFSDLMTVNETAVEPPQDDGSSMNAPANLALEATFINQNFSQQVLRKVSKKLTFLHSLLCLKIEEEGAVHQFGDPNPFVDEEEEGEVASVGYRYRKFQLSENVQLIARCELDAALPPAPGSTDIQCINIKALNEWDPQIIVKRYSVSRACLYKKTTLPYIVWRFRLATQIGYSTRRRLGNRTEEQ